MDTTPTMRETQRSINEATMDMDTETYCWFMRELAQWCETQANLQEYREEAVFNDNE